MSAILFGACGDDDSPSTPRAEEVIPSIDAFDVAPADAPRTDEPARWIPCDGSMAATLAVTNWELRAPGACGEKQNCGHVLVRATNAGGGVVKVRAVTKTVFVPLVEPADWAGTVNFVAQLSLDGGTPYLTAAGAVVEKELSLDLPLKTNCDAGEGGGGGAGAGGNGGLSNGGNGGSANAGTSQGGVGASSGSGDSGSGDSGSGDSGSGNSGSGNSGSGGMSEGG